MFEYTYNISESFKYSYDPVQLSDEINVSAIIDQTIISINAN